MPTFTNNGHTMAVQMHHNVAQNVTQHQILSLLSCLLLAHGAQQTQHIIKSDSEMGELHDDNQNA